MRNCKTGIAKGLPALNALTRSNHSRPMGPMGGEFLFPLPQTRPMDVFLSDLPGFAVALNQVYQPTTYRFDKDRRAVGRVKAFPENVLLEVGLHYTTDNPRTFSVTLPDVRSIPIVVKYELSSLKETGYRPPVADDRVRLSTPCSRPPRRQHSGPPGMALLSGPPVRRGSRTTQEGFGGGPEESAGALHFGTGV